MVHMTAGASTSQRPSALRITAGGPVTPSEPERSGSALQFQGINETCDGRTETAQLRDVLNFSRTLSQSPSRPNPPLINLAEVIWLSQPQIAPTKIASCFPRVRTRSYRPRNRSEHRRGQSVCVETRGRLSNLCNKHWKSGTMKLQRAPVASSSSPASFTSE